MRRFVPPAGNRPPHRPFRPRRRQRRRGPRGRPRHRPASSHVSHPRVLRRRWRSCYGQQGDRGSRRNPRCSLAGLEKMQKCVALPLFSPFSPQVGQLAPRTIAQVLGFKRPPSRLVGQVAPRMPGPPRYYGRQGDNGSGVTAWHGFSPVPYRPRYHLRAGRKVETPVTRFFALLTPDARTTSHSKVRHNDRQAVDRARQRPLRQHHSGTKMALTPMESHPTREYPYFDPKLAYEVRLAP